MIKSIKYFALALAAAFGFMACEKPDDEGGTTPVEPATLNIVESLVQVGGDGGEFSFTYVLENGDFDVLEPVCTESWIHDFDLSIKGLVSFTVDANTTEGSRITQIVLKHGDISDKVVVSQTGVVPEPVEASFDITYDINGPFVRMYVSPDPENVRYYAWYYSKKGMEQALAQSPGVDIEMYLNKLVEVEMSEAIYYGAYAGYTPEQAVAELTMVGPSYQDFELNAETGYYGFACAVSNSGERLSNVTITEFTTGPVEPSDNVFTVTADDVNSDRITYSIKTTNNDQYAAIVFAADQVEGKTDAEIVSMYSSMSNYIGYLHFGDYSGTVLVGEDDADYYILAFGFEYGMATTDITRLKVHTLPSTPDAIPEFTFSIDKVTNFRIEGSVTADPHTSLYYVDWCYADDNPDGLKQLVREAAMWYVDNGYYSNLAACMKVIGTKGTTEFNYQGLTPNEEYKIFAIGIDEKTGEFNTDVIFSETIKTPAKEVSKSNIEIAIDKYFDGYDLATAYPNEFGDAEGWAVVPLDVKVNGDVVDYYYDIYVGDVAADPYATDDALILDLEQYGNHNTPLTMSYCYFNEVLTLVYFSKDADDNNSEVTKVKFTLRPENCSPVSEFNYGKPGTAQAKSLRRFTE